MSLVRPLPGLWRCSFTRAPWLRASYAAWAALDAGAAGGEPELPGLPADGPAGGAAAGAVPPPPSSLPGRHFTTPDDPTAVHVQLPEIDGQPVGQAVKREVPHSAPVRPLAGAQAALLQLP